MNTHTGSSPWDILIDCSRYKTSDVKEEIIEYELKE